MVGWVSRGLKIGYSFTYERREAFCEKNENLASSLNFNNLSIFPWRNAACVATTYIASRGTLGREKGLKWKVFTIYAFTTM
jgi:hypothetical protein